MSNSPTTHRMIEGVVLSRRGFVAVVASLPTTVTATDQPDGVLITHGQTFQRLAMELDDAIAGKHELRDITLREFGTVADAIVTTPARTVLGLRVKAQAACWALLGNIEGPAHGTIDQKMARAIVRDLIRQFEPELEDADAIRKLTAMSTCLTPAR